jgi:hypothetical protein
MKTIFASTMIALLLMIILTGAAFATPAEKELLLKGSIQSLETYEINFPIMSVTASGSGNATQLGLFTVSYEVQVNLLTVSGPGSAHFIAANGDSIFAEGSGQATETGTPGVFNVIENYTITGGTGRFAGAGGNITLDRVVDTTTGVTSGTISGVIELP